AKAFPRPDRDSDCAVAEVLQSQSGPSELLSKQSEPGLLSGHHPAQGRKVREKAQRRALRTANRGLRITRIENARAVSPRTTIFNRPALRSPHPSPLPKEREPLPTSVVVVSTRPSDAWTKILPSH